MAMKRAAGAFGCLILILMASCTDRNGETEGTSGVGGTAPISGMSSGARAGDGGRSGGTSGGSAGSSNTAGAGNLAGGTGGGASGGEQSGCGVDIVVTDRILDDDERWTGGLTPHAVWQSERGIHIAWQGTERRLDLSPDPVRSWLHISTFASGDGMLQQTSPIDLFPPETTVSKSAITSGAGAPDGSFLVTYRYWPQIGAPTNYRHWGYLGRVDEAERGERIVIFDGDQPTPSILFSGWDGEAFAIHAQARDVDKNDALVGRLDTTGRLVAEFIPYTAGAGDGWGILGYKISTEPTSGRSFLFDAPTGYRALTGHERDGTRVSWVPESGWVNVKVPIFETDGGSRPMVRTDPEGGVWMAWNQAESRYAHYSASGELDAYGKFNWANASMFLPRGGPRAELYAITSEFRLYRYDIDGMTISEPTIVVDSPCKANDCNPFWLGAFERDGETWVWFQEPHPDVFQLLRIVKVVPGCTYGPAQL